MSKKGCFYAYEDLQKFSVEIYEALNRLRSDMMNEVFQFQMQNQHNLRNNSALGVPSFNTIFRRK